MKYFEIISQWLVSREKNRFVYNFHSYVSRDVSVPAPVGTLENLIQSPSSPQPVSQCCGVVWIFDSFNNGGGYEIYWNEFGLLLPSCDMISAKFYFHYNEYLSLLWALNWCMKILSMLIWIDFDEPKDCNIYRIFWIVGKTRPNSSNRYPEMLLLASH